MPFEIVTSSGTPDDGFRQYVEQRLHSGLMRFENRIARATVSFVDLSGPCGAEQQCRLALGLVPGGEVIVERRGASAKLALGRAVETATRELRRRLDATDEQGRRAP